MTTTTAIETYQEKCQRERRELCASYPYVYRAIPYEVAILDARIRRPSRGLKPGGYAVSLEGDENHPIVAMYFDAQNNEWQVNTPGYGGTDYTRCAEREGLPRVEFEQTSPHSWRRVNPKVVRCWMCERPAVAGLVGDSVHARCAQHPIPVGRL